MMTFTIVNCFLWLWVVITLLSAPATSTNSSDPSSTTHQGDGSTTAGVSELTTTDGSGDNQTQTSQSGASTPVSNSEQTQLLLNLLRLIQDPVIISLITDFGREAQELVGNFTSASVFRQSEAALSSFQNFVSNPTVFLSDTLNISEKCINQSQIWLGSLGTDQWAQQMLDAWAKPERGLLKGNIKWLGSYDQCLSIKPIGTPEVPISSAKYCTAYIPGVVPAVIPAAQAQIELGLCLPSGCTDSDLSLLIRTLTSLVSPNITSYAVCKEEKEFSTGAIVSLCLLMVPILLSIVGTVLDARLEILKSKQKNYKLDGAGSGGHDNGAFIGVDEKLANGETETKLNGAVENKPALMLEIKKPVEQKENVGIVFLKCFSLYTNGCKLLSFKQPPGSLACLNGLRVISLSWVILGHTIFFSIPLFTNGASLLEWLQRFSFQAIINASVSVDTFFVLSGLLTAYLMLKELEKRRPSAANFFSGVPVMYLHRYLRLTPVYAIIIVFWTLILQDLYNGPMWPKDTFDGNCKTSSWTNMLYINNVVKVDQQCLGWSWYLANDFQFFLVSPFLVYLMFSSPKVGVTLVTIIPFISATGATFYSIIKEFQFGDDMSKTYTFYVVPWYRCQTYHIGLLAGYLTWKLKGSLKISTLTNLWLWMMAAVFCTAPLYGVYDVYKGWHKATLIEHGFYNGWMRLSWSLGVSWVIIACTTGNGGWVNTFLSWSGFVPLGKLSYCAYLLHPILMVANAYGSRKLTELTVFTLVNMFSGFLLLSFVVAFAFSLLFEAPALNIDKEFLTGALMKRATHMQKKEASTNGHSKSTATDMLSQGHKPAEQKC